MEFFSAAPAPLPPVRGAGIQSRNNKSNAQAHTHLPNRLQCKMCANREPWYFAYLPFGLRLPDSAVVWRLTPTAVCTALDMSGHKNCAQPIHWDGNKWHGQSARLHTRHQRMRKFINKSLVRRPNACEIELALVGRWRIQNSSDVSIRMCAAFLQWKQVKIAFTTFPIDRLNVIFSRFRCDLWGSER